MTRQAALGVGVVIAGLLAFMAARSGRSPSVPANISGKKETPAAQPDGDTEQPATSNDHPDGLDDEPDDDSNDEPDDEPDDGDVDEADDDRAAEDDDRHAGADDAFDDISPDAAHFFAQESARAGHLLGDLHLAGEVDLKRARLSGDAYIVDNGERGKLVLTLDHTLQKAAEDALARARSPKAAIVVMSVDGRILALVGRRGKQSAPELATEVWAPAASVFKVITAAALVKAGVGKNRKVCYHGGVRSVVASNLEDDKRRDRRCNTLSYAIARSQNAIIAKLAHRHLQPADLRAMAQKFGLGASPPFALSVDAGRADIPDEPLPFARVAAGFWQTELSPMGGAMVAATVASMGHAVTPHIVTQVVKPGPGGEQVTTLQLVPPRRVIAARVAREVTDMMVGTTDYGSARKGFRDRRGNRFLKDIKVAGKTGTLTARTRKYLQYSWFVGFAPADRPEYVISVLIGNPELWHIKAHTAARMVLQEAFAE